jgi:hypothetical protein
MLPTIISPIRVEWSASIACLLILLWASNGDTMSLCLPQSTQQMQDSQYGATDTWCFICVSINRCGNTQCDIRPPHDCMHTSNSHVRFLQYGMNGGQPTSALTHNNLLSHSVLWFSNSVSLSHSWHFHHSITAHSKHTHTTLSFIHMQPLNFSKLTSLLSGELNHCTLVLFWLISHLLYHIKLVLYFYTRVCECLPSQTHSCAMNRVSCA